ncbi:MAG: hypothetical protein M3P49_00835 [Actinomycetota bacterium]|nr:hypothetical protein [Actinomycetota bacterium]
MPEKKGALHSAAEEGKDDLRFRPRAGRGPLADEETPIDDLAQAVRGEHQNPQEPQLLDEDDEDYGGDGGLIDLIGEYWYFVVGLSAAIVVLMFLASRLLGGGGEAPQQQAGPAGGEAPAAESAEPLEPTETGIVFEEPEQKDGAYYLKAGDIAWKGELENTDTGQQLTLEGPWAAQFKESVAFARGSIMTGVFGRAEPGQPIVHSTYHRTVVGDEEVAAGTYTAVDAGRILVEGTYSDERDGNTVVRTYREWAPTAPENVTTYAASFEAPPRVPVPALIGWKPPAPVREQEAG